MDRRGFSVNLRAIIIYALIVLLLAGTSAGEVSREGLVAEWLFDEGSGNVLKDSSGNGNNGVIYGATWVDGKFGKALSFDGQNDYVEVQDSPSLNPPNQITIEAWYQPVSFIGGGNDGILDKPFTSFNTPFYQYHLGVRGDGFNIHPATFGFDTTINNNWIDIYSDQGVWKAGQWYHIIGMYDGSAVKLYINSQLITSKPALGQINSYGMNVRIGDYANHERFLYGTIDEIRIYNRSLSADEVKANYESASIPSAPKLNLIKTLSPSTITESGSTTISINVENAGLDAKSIKVTDTTPLDFTLISGATSQEYALLKAGETRTYQYIVKSSATGKYVTEKATATFSDEKGNSYTSASNTVTISVSSPSAPIQTSAPSTVQQTSTFAPKQTQTPLPFYSEGTTPTNTQTTETSEPLDWRYKSLVIILVLAVFVEIKIRYKRLKRLKINWQDDMWLYILVGILVGIILLIFSKYW
jgi:hypothetical protein